MTLKPVFRWSQHERMYRVARLIWCRGTVGDGRGYSAKLTLAVAPRMLSVQREWCSFIVTVLGIRVHYQRSYGGIHT